jgi:hypothetical protein
MPDAQQVGKGLVIAGGVLFLIDRATDLTGIGLLDAPILTPAAIALAAIGTDLQCNEGNTDETH